MIKVNENTCIGCGSCVAISPEHFDFDDNGLAKAISQEVNDSVMEASNSCPVSAIEITEENTEASE